MKQAAVRGLITGLALSLAVLSAKPAWMLGTWVGELIHGPRQVYLDVR